MESVRTFLAQCITSSECEPNWEPRISTTSVQLSTEDARRDCTAQYLTWICQRELQTIVAKSPSEEENLPGNAALIMLFILGFPLLFMRKLDGTGATAYEIHEDVEHANRSSGSSMHSNLDLRQQVRRASTSLSPQDISTIIQCDADKGTLSLRLQNDSDETRFLWQDWVDAAVGYMKAFEDGKNGALGYKRKILRADLRRPMVDLNHLLTNYDGIDYSAERASNTRVWTGWPALDTRICKFEINQWLDTCDIDLRNWHPDEAEED